MNDLVGELEDSDDEVIIVFRAKSLHLFIGPL